MLHPGEVFRQAGARRQSGRERGGAARIVQCGGAMPQVRGLLFAPPLARLGDVSFEHGRVGADGAQRLFERALAVAAREIEHARSRREALGERRCEGGDVGGRLQRQRQSGFIRGGGGAAADDIDRQADDRGARGGGEQRDRVDAGRDDRVETLARRRRAGRRHAQDGRQGDFEAARAQLCGASISVLARSEEGDPGAHTSRRSLL